MLALNLLGGSTPPAVRQPICTLQFGSAAPASSLGGLALTVGNALGINSGGAADVWKEHLISLSVESGLAPFVDVVEIVIAIGAQAPRVTVGDEGTVSLGYGDDAANLVFTGQIERVRYGLNATQLIASNSSTQLARLRVNQSYEQQSAGDIVKNLVGQAAVETDVLENGIDFPFYIVDDGCNVYQQVAKLARKSNYAAWLTPEGKLNFAPLHEGAPVATFTYGDNILSLQMSEAAPIVGTVTALGEGAASSQGASAWSWLVKEPSAVTGSAGDGTPTRLLQDSSLRSSNAAQSAADGANQAARRLQITGKLVALGAPKVVPGSTITITNAMPAIANSNFLVQRVRHHFSKADGFTTLIIFSKTG